MIGEFGVAKRDPLAVKALDLFVSTYGAFAGNLALATLAHGGVYIAGGIAPKLGAKMADGTFMRAFNDKGRFTDLLKTIPVHIVMNPKVGLYGALLEAERSRRHGLPHGSTSLVHRRAGTAQPDAVGSGSARSNACSSS